jgi:uncharacterized protein YbjT (DUF2867 family)
MPRPSRHADFHADRPSVLVAGASGLVGRALIDQLLEDRNTGTVHALVRRTVEGLPDSKHLLTHVVDVAAPGYLPVAYECYICLGTTIKDAGSQEAFRAVDFDAVFAIASKAKEAGVSSLALVSALGADPASSVFYNQVKGEVEAAVASLGFDRLVIARPSLLAGDRKALGQRPRALEQALLALTRPVRALIPAAWRPIDARTLARAMVQAVRGDGPSVQILESAQLLDIGSATSGASARRQPSFVQTGY